MSDDERNLKIRSREKYSLMKGIGKATVHSNLRFRYIALATRMIREKGLAVTLKTAKLCKFYI